METIQEAAEQTGLDSILSPAAVPILAVVLIVAVVVVWRRRRAQRAAAWDDE